MAELLVCIAVVLFAHGAGEGHMERAVLKIQNITKLGDIL